MSTRLEVRAGETTVIAEADDNGAVRIADTEFRVEAAGAGLYRVSDGARTWTVAVAGPPDDRWVFVDGQVARLEVSSGTRARRKARGGGHDALTAPMPATVVKLLVDAGAAVKQGQTLIVLEAMKMELPVRAPRDGIVRQVACRQGELVQPGVPLLELE